MTIDDETSVYVGNLPYDATEDSIRSVFDLYGQIIAVKGSTTLGAASAGMQIPGTTDNIINDRGIGGKCYGFVTFTNPRSAVDAINDMDGRTVDGRVVKVNEVKTRGGRSNFGRDGFRRNDRDVELDRGRDRDRERDYGRVRDRSRDQNREWSRDRDQDKERGYDRARDLDRSRERFVDRDRGHDRDKDMDGTEHEHERDHEQAWEKDRQLDRDQVKEMRRSDIHHRSGNKYKDQTAKLANGERHSREHPSGSSHGDQDQVAKQLDVSRQKIEELQKEVFRMEELVEERGDHVSKLQEKSQKLEGALASAKKLTSNRKKQLIKLLVGSTMKELENHNGVDTDGLLANANG
ncbi:hypothetical protein Ccrd_020444 [Cynara cardunculus var. scolymus]|uniref:RRM domain-containing protein n=1 Tax=Cynara cardunculus var. scolymus TaxID=59895 RepID=A0A103Y2F0_CYNCS|nr:hypothetical protein Ccrd_020444 [Cynara cardunculus var. scolymus]